MQDHIYWNLLFLLKILSKVLEVITDYALSKKDELQWWGNQTEI